MTKLLLCQLDRNRYYMIGIGVKTDSIKECDEPNLFVGLTDDVTMKNLSGLEKITEMEFRKSMRDHNRRRETYCVKNIYRTKQPQKRESGITADRTPMK
uniref:Uncharacterized protein n=1 Tax=Ciona intestinalis TaxID=7719 RepID=H2Y0S4_CIOIN